jgi:hypothetical protein
MGYERDRLRRIESNMKEEERKRGNVASAAAKKEIQEIVGHDIVNHDKLKSIVANVWLSLPPSQAKSFTADDWIHSVHQRCEGALQKAEQHLAANNQGDDKMLAAKVKTLRVGFANQVRRAINEYAAEHNAKHGIGK